MSLARAIVYQSDAVLPATVAMVEDEIHAGQLVRIEIEPLPVSVRPCQFYRRGRTPSPAALTFMEILREADAKMTATNSVSSRPRRSTRRSTTGKRKR